MFGFVQKIFGGSKSEKDARKLQPAIQKVNKFFAEYQSFSNDQLRGKTQEFKQRIKDHLAKVDTEIAELNAKAEALTHTELLEKDTIYRQVDELKKDRDKEIEKVLEEIMPEAFAVVKETARRFKENTEIV